MVTAISVEVFQGVLQTERKWREAIEAEMNIPQSETQTFRRVIPSELDVGSDVEKPITRALCGSGCEENQDDC